MTSLSMLPYLAIASTAAIYSNFILSEYALLKELGGSHLRDRMKGSF
jgi:hypothetical protein